MDLFGCHQFLSSVGHLLNRALRSVSTVVPYKSLLIDGKWRVGFTASRDLLPGAELTWDYRCTPGGLCVYIAYYKDV